MKKSPPVKREWACQTEIKQKVGLNLVRPERIGRGPRFWTGVRDQKTRFGSCLESLRAMTDVLREKRNAP
jgi:hypothetical protein